MTRVPDPLIYSGKKRQETGTPCCGVIALLCQFDRSYADRPLVKSQTVFLFSFLFFYYYVIASSANNMSNIVSSLSMWPFIISLFDWCPQEHFRIFIRHVLFEYAVFKFTVILCVLWEHWLISSIGETRVITLGGGANRPWIFFYHGATALQWAPTSSLSRINDHTQ